MMFNLMTQESLHDSIASPEILILTENRDFGVRTADLDLHRDGAFLGLGVGVGIEQGGFAVLEAGWPKFSELGDWICCSSEVARHGCRSTTTHLEDCFQNQSPGFRTWGTRALCNMHNPVRCVLGIANAGLRSQDGKAL